MEKELSTKIIKIIKDYCKKEDIKNFLDYIAPFSSHKTDEIGMVFDNYETHNIIDLAYETIVLPSFDTEVEKLDYLRWIEDKSALSYKEKYELLRLAFIYKIYKTKLNIWSKEKYKNELRYIEEIETDNDVEFYRGQSNYDWKMSPSVLRDLNEDLVLDDNGYYHLIKQNGLLAKYETVFKNANIKGAYNRYAFLQHSCSYSPFIDFTKDPIIGTSFALSNTSTLNTFYFKDSALFVISPLRALLAGKEIINDAKKATAFLKQNMNIKVINSDKICFGRTYYFNKYDTLGNVRKISLSMSSISQIIKELTPSYLFIDCPTNDRMVYQRGLFLVLYNCVTLRSNVLYDLNPFFTFWKYRITTNSKRRLLDQITQKYNHYSYRFLMNPYQWFNE